jgi:hypothetical protein
MHKLFVSIRRLLPRWPFMFSLAIAAAVLWQHQAVFDWVRLSNYTPPASVSQLSDEIMLTSKAQKLFYVNHPAVEDRESFSKACSNRGEHTIVLGCYHPVDRGIFIFHVSDERLNGVDQVTAAHEMLHAAYDRLGGRQRSRIDAMLQDYYKSGLYDERIKTIMAAYQKTEPNDVVNEMHSIFGTEVSVLPSSLEEYYSQYFRDRSRVVGYASDYQGEFTSRQTRVTDYDARLKTMKEQINGNSDSLERQQADITALRARLDSDRNSGNIEAYNANVPVYNDRIDSYNYLINSTK